MQTLDMPADTRASIEAEKNASLRPAPAQASEEKPAAMAAPSAEKPATEQTQASAQATTATTEAVTAAPEQTQPDDIFEFDPTKPYKLPDGTVLKGSQVLQGMAKKADLDKERWQFNKEKEQLLSKLGWVDIAEKNDSARILLQLLDAGIPQDEALRRAAKQIGLTLDEQKQAATAPVSSTDFSIDPAELEARLPAIPTDMSQEELNVWWQKVYEPKRLQTIMQMTLEANARVAEHKAAAAQQQADERAKVQAQGDKLAAHNDSMLEKSRDYLYQLYGIDYHALDKTQQADVITRLDAALQENGLGWVADEDGKRKNVLRETDIKAVVHDAFPENANPYKAPSRPRPTTSQEKPLSAEAPVSQVASTGLNGFSPENYATPMDAALAALASDK